MTKSKNQRSRGGCISCKHRKKKCNEVKPTCGTCERMGITCQYVKKLYWNDTNQSSNRHYTIRTVPPKFFLTTTVEDMKLNTRLQNPNNNSTMPYRLKVDSVPKQEHPQEAPNLNPNIESDLFDHYVEVVSKKKVFGNLQLNGFRSIIIPHCITSPSLFQSIIAISASDLIRRYPTHTYFSKLTTKYKNEAINLMYNLLDDFGKERIDEIVTSILILCSLEIGEDLNSNWVNYLKQSCLIFSTLNDEDILQSEVLLFCYRYFILRYILLLSSLNRLEYFYFTNNFPMKFIDTFFKDDSVDYMLGCSPKLIQIIGDITRLKNNDDSIDPSQVGEIYDALFALREEHEDLKLNFCSQLYLHTVKIHLASTFESQLNSLHLTIDTEFHVQEVLKIFQNITNYESPTLFPTWCILILSVCNYNVFIRHQVLDTCVRVEKNWPRSSATLLKGSIQVIWKIRDLTPGMDWRDIFSSLNIKLCLT
ncbi:hypothetical protein CANTEDRAFT_91547 [Yamadazyma tenuis ATCC 10573]|uniref:Zn(2)-C6 fungal-type domain-containing protein n=1 Tax=Candida tenuis (strain ATCC 10573 / BCRC 21748 / CBS 615 / JCM 9827 / NBRC 10315 / NRRL Y-1498 / VKM Y-70) TaxID=590646 RepID=G3AXH9_CANTC|nr:uncharacterized protein CANTEDRAFT_91547 [Yamadazyma tenuis ATCC 10573]EGV66385.1 hypothetical protein CANTEDRAFT_91547 [Yamadazyma tenuis ATCC 10573]